MPASENSVHLAENRSQVSYVPHVANLRRSAERYRRSADFSNDPEITTALLKIASAYDARAAQLSVKADFRADVPI